MEYIVTYQKGNGDVFLRPRTCLFNLKVGDETPMGWKVLNILYEYEGNYYTYIDWCRVRKGKEIKHRKKKKLIKYLIRQLNKLA